MKSPNLLSIFSTLLILIIPFISAWPWPIELPEAGALVARQNSNSAQPTQTQAPSSSQVSSSASQSNSGSNQPSSTNSNSNSNSNSQTASITGSVSGGSSSVGSATRASGTNYKNSTLSAIDPRDPPGGVSMITPAATDGMTFVKVGNYVTFKWNYTSLLRAPSYIDVIATNTVNSQTYTIASNQTWQSTQAITWDTGSWTQTTDLPFVIATYTLMVYDANSGPTAIPSAGYLGAFSNLQFGIYTPQPYTPLNDFRCATCSISGAMSRHEKQALSVLLGTCAITVLSFTWFASGFGLF